MKSLLLVLLLFPLTGSAEYDIPQCKTEKSYYEESITVYFASKKIYNIDKKLFNLKKITVSEFRKSAERASLSKERIVYAQQIYTTCQKKYRIMI